MKKQEILKIAQANAERISAIEKHLGINQPEETKQLEVGKWYWASEEARSDKSCLFNYQELNSYGFNWECKWSDDIKSLPELGGRIEATPQEVEEALIAEAKRRGFKNGFIARVKHADESESFWNGKDPERYIFKNNTLYYYSDIYPIFKNGKWATIIEQDKFAELKEAHKNGAVIEYRHNDRCSWEPVDSPVLNTDCQYRIKPEEKPKEGDIYKFWDNDENEFVVGKLHSYTHGSGLPYQTDSWNCFKNAKPLSKSEAIALLFGKEETNDR